MLFILSRLQITKVSILTVSKQHLLVVSVPVLSEQMVVALPIVSQASRCLTRLLSDIIFWRGKNICGRNFFKHTIWLRRCELCPMEVWLSGG